MKKYALLVGIEQYGAGLACLKYACRDVYGIGQALKSSCQFDKVRILADQEDNDFGQVRCGQPVDTTILQELEDATVQLKPDDLFVFLFAGHGVELADGNIKHGYLLAQNAASKFRRGYLGITELKGLLSNLACRQRMILLDCCRNEPESARGDQDNLMSAVLSRELIEASTRHGSESRATILMMACRSGQRAYEWEQQQHGLFSYFLKQGLEREGWQNGQLEGRVLCAYVERQITEWARKKQVSQQPEFQQLESAQAIMLVGKAEFLEPKIPFAETRRYKCEICGRRNVEEFTFECKQCGRDYLCNEHYRSNRKCCEDCEEKAISVAQQQKKRFELKEKAKKRVQEETEKKPENATKDKPWENSLGMRFVPVPNTKVLFSIFETRVRDYAAYSKAMPEIDNDWMMPLFEQKPTHPVVNVGWEDAQGFCHWLTEKDQKEGRIGIQQRYRLPTDEEWSWAVGLPKEEGQTPKEKDKKIKNHYPWGTQWPPPKGAGNYYLSLKVDGYPYTSPVGNFTVNQYGLYDMGGNVWEWCQDWYDKKKQQGILRGASWDDFVPEFLLSSYRHKDFIQRHHNLYGFRVVLGSTAP